MPTRTQRRNTAYLNRRISRIGQLDRDREGQPLGVPYLDELLPRIAPLDRRAKTKLLFIPDLCVLTVELSGARAEV
jgi:hypothetical protein